MKKRFLFYILILTILLTFAACGGKKDSGEPGDSAAGRLAVSGADSAGSRAEFIIPEYQGEPSVVINDNIPEFVGTLPPGFAEQRLAKDSFESYGKLDKRGRCTTAFANLSVDTQPGGESRGDISMIHPSGWQSGQGWERCHLIGWQLGAENDNRRNLVTGTHYMNVDGMLPYENQVASYIEETGNHVLYEVTPIFAGKNMVCSGVHMQAASVEDDGVAFNVFCFNVSPGHEIDYRTGRVTVVDEELAAVGSFERTYVINKNTMRFHYPSCTGAAQIAEHNKETVDASRQELIEQGYQPCGMCEP